MRESNLLANGRKGTFKPIEHKDLPDMIDSKCDEGEDGPERVCRHEDVSGTRDGQEGGRWHLKHRVCDGVDGVHDIEVFALETHRLLHPTDVGGAVTGPVDAEEEPYQREIDENRGVELHQQRSLDSGGPPYRSLDLLHEGLYWCHGGSKKSSRRRQDRTRFQDAPQDTVHCTAGQVG